MKKIIVSDVTLRAYAEAKSALSFREKLNIAQWLDAAGVDAVLYGHTHEALCARESDGLWVMNPGSCGYFGGSVGLMEIKDQKIASCRLLRQDDLEAFV